ncbi:hypothetical protein CW304_04410 [Bacillus sp. UFRGS-B20]|nr:hypothetical protein CW304_04410 [Bacillus sp. UFRGS-B20]
MLLCSVQVCSIDIIQIIFTFLTKYKLTHDLQTANEPANSPTPTAVATYRQVLNNDKLPLIKRRIRIICSNNV